MVVRESGRADWKLDRLVDNAGLLHGERSIYGP